MDWKAFFQTLISAAVNAGLGMLVAHYGGASAGVGAMAVGTMVAHSVNSPYNKN